MFRTERRYQQDTTILEAYLPLPGGHVFSAVLL